MSDPVLGTMDMQKQVAAKAMGGIPLTVVATEGDRVFVEDPDGIAFTIPRSWTTQNVEQGFNLDHKAIDAAPPGELERVWRDATTGAAQEQGTTQASASLLDDYNEGTYTPGDKRTPFQSAGMPVKGGSGPGGARTDANEAASIDARDFTGNGTMEKSSLPPWNPSVAKGLKNPNPTGVTPANAGSNFGNWDETWDEKRGMWVNKYTGKARKP
jgi:hypothetical protein